MRLLRVSDEKNLRVIVSVDLKWEKQCSSIVCVAMLSMISVILYYTA